MEVLTHGLWQCIQRVYGVQYMKTIFDILSARTQCMLRGAYMRWGWCRCQRELIFLKVLVHVDGIHSSLYLRA